MGAQGLTNHALCPTGGSHRQQQWCLGALKAAFLARMQDVLAVYERPHDPLFPVGGFDD